MDRKNKKAVSMMISYVLLISIAIALSIGVFAWLRTYANVEPLPECKPETSLRLEGYTCETISINLSVKNNGLFNISGYTLLVGNTTQRLPIHTLSVIASQLNVKLHTLGPGHVVFKNPLRPGETQSISFNMGDTYKRDVKIVQIQAFILSEKEEKVPCENAIITEEVNCDYP